MLDAKLYSELSPKEQSAQPVGFRRADSVRIVGSHQCAGYELRDFVRAAIDMLESQAVEQDATAVAMKALALLKTGSSRVVAIGGWATPGRYYDPLPGLLELQKLAAERLGPAANDNKWIVRFRIAIGGAVLGAKFGVAA